MNFTVVLVGRTQLPSPLTVTAQLSVEGAPRIFQFQWPN